jgi:hypothetical protein
MRVLIHGLIVALIVELRFVYSANSRSIQSHYNGRLKGERSSDVDQRYLQEDEHPKAKKHAGNLLLTLNQVVRFHLYCCND